jgi:hypothetical protein
VPRSPWNSVQMPAKELKGRSSFSANQTTSFFLVSGLVSGAYSAKLLNGTRQICGFSQPRPRQRTSRYRYPAFYSITEHRGWLRRSLVPKHPLVSGFAREPIGLLAGILRLLCGGTDRTAIDGFA